MATKGGRTLGPWGDFGGKNWPGKEETAPARKGARRTRTNSPNKVKQVRYGTRILASNYAVWVAQNKPTRRNERRIQKIKHGMLKRFLRRHGVTGRIKTHDHKDRSFILYQQFQQGFSKLLAGE
jgi:hypothetical protein